MSAFAASERIGDLLGDYRPSDIAEVRVETGSIPATFAVFAVGLLAGALVNIGYAAYLLTRNQSWDLLARSPRELLLAMHHRNQLQPGRRPDGQGDAPAGCARGVDRLGDPAGVADDRHPVARFPERRMERSAGKPRMQMYLAIAIFIVAAFLMAYGNTLAKN